MAQSETRFAIMTPAEWQAFMLNEVAYIKPVTKKGETAWAIHAADGTELAHRCDRDSAVAAVRNHELQVVLVH